MDRPTKRPAQRCSACGLVSPGSSVRCECGSSFVTGEPPTAVVRRGKLGWENLGGALVFALVFGATSILLTVHGEWPIARAVFGIAAALALAGGGWAFARIPHDQRTWSSMPKRGAKGLAVMSVVFVGVIAYGLHDYLGTTYVVGHDCTSDTQCRSSHCFGARGDSPGVCTDYCDNDVDCPANMICTEGLSVSQGWQSTSRTKANFCTFGHRAAPP